jgi:hypothetical protein
MVKLTSKGRKLYLNDEILIVRYPEGDCDTIPWPCPIAWKLAGALYDAREMGELPANDYEVELPDGQIFNIDKFVR